MNEQSDPGRRLLKPDPMSAILHDGKSANRKTVRVMIVDDSLTVRTILKRMVASVPSFEIVGTASSAERAIAQLKSTPADVVLLDLDMPGMGGLEALPALLDTADETQVLVVSSLTKDGAETTMAALSMGAADTMLKPLPGGFNEAYRAQLVEKIAALGGSSTEGPGKTARPQDTFASRNVALELDPRPEVIAIGASTGGIHALNVMLSALEPDFDIPILITQHLPASFMTVFARQVEMAARRPTIVAREGTEISRGTVIIAPGDGHMTVRRIADRLAVRITNDPAPSGCLPSVDPMLSSLSDACGGKVLAVILSGMGRDGLEGARALAAKGGTVVAQSAETSAVWGMPGAVAKEGLTRLVAAPEDIASAIMSIAPAVASK